MIANTRHRRFPIAKISSRQPDAVMITGTAEKQQANNWWQLSQYRSPGAIAGGIAFGSMLGLIPKDNLLALFLLAMVALLPINQLFACAVACLVSLVGPWTTPFTDWIGYQVLRWELVGSVLASLYTLPMVPWFRLENTIVMGSMIVGLVLWIPAYYLSLRASIRFYRAITANDVAQLAAASLRHRKPTSPAPTTDFLAPEPKPIAAIGTTTNDLKLETQATALESEPHWLVASSIPPNPDPSSESNLSSQLVSENDSLEGLLHETLIEVIRFKEPIHSSNTQSSKSSTESMSLTDLIRKDSSSSQPLRGNAVETSVSHTGDDPLAVAGLPSNNEQVYRSHMGAKENPLRHLMKHIHGSRESKRDLERSS
jgi:uncharacterized protein (TIGR03546 family)